MKHELAVLALWLIAIVTTMLLVHDPSTFSRLAPVFAVCTIGSVVTVRRAKARR